MDKSKEARGKQHPRGRQHRGGQARSVEYKSASTARAEDAIKLNSAPVTRGNLRFIALGGGSEIGKNCMLYEYGDDMVIVDLGLTFPDDRTLGIDYILPDIKYIEANKHKVRGIIITHAHEDHIGGVPFLWPKIGAPIYGTALTIGLLEEKMIEYPHIAKIPTHVVNPDTQPILQFGQLKVEIFRLAHSIPGNIGTSVTAPGIGRIVNSMEFRFDFSPIDKWSTDIQKLARWGDEGALALFSDSVNALEAGFSSGEKFLDKVFDEVFTNAKGRVIVASFSSQINRLQQIINSIRKTDRKIAIAGRSMLKYLSVAAKLGYIRIPPGMMVKLDSVKNVPDNKLVVLSTGSQGEENSSLMRMAHGRHKQIQLKRGDTVLISASPIPGNEVQVGRTVNGLFKLGADVILDESNSPTHVSGHPVQGELQLMLNLVRPKFFFPINGEYRMQLKHAEIAHDLGMPKPNVFTIESGEIIEFTPAGEAKVIGKIPVGETFVDSEGLSDIDPSVLRDRTLMAADGVFVAIASVAKASGRLIDVNIISRGFVFMKDNGELIRKASDVARRVMSKVQSRPSDWTAIKSELRDEIGAALRHETGGRPMVLPVIIEV